MDASTSGTLTSGCYIDQQRDLEKIKDDVRELTSLAGVSVYTYCRRDFDTAVRGLC